MSTLRRNLRIISIHLLSRQVFGLSYADPTSKDQYTISDLYPALSFATYVKGLNRTLRLSEFLSVFLFHNSCYVNVCVFYISES